MTVELVKEFIVEAAHQEPAAQGRDARLHGHSLRIEVVVEGEIDPELGWLIDFGDIKRAFRPIEAQLDHQSLMDLPGLTDPSLAGLAAWIRERLVPGLPCLKEIRVTPAGDNTFAPMTLDADPARRLPRRLRFSFEAAQSLPHLPESHPCRRLHGHTYRVEVGAHDLDRLRSALRDVYDALDHVSLDEVPGLESATSERLCQWIWNRLTGRCDDLTVVVVQETASARCIYHGD